MRTIEVIAIAIVGISAIEAPDSSLIDRCLVGATSWAAGRDGHSRGFRV